MNKLEFIIINLIFIIIIILITILKNKVDTIHLQNYYGHVVVKKYEIPILPNIMKLSKNGKNKIIFCDEYSFKIYDEGDTLQFQLPPRRR